MSNYFIKIFCNGEKTRSTGAHKWYRQELFYKFGFNRDFKSARNVDISKEGKEMLKFLYEQIPEYIKKENKYVAFFEIELIHKTKSGKKSIINSKLSPISFRRESSKIWIENLSDRTKYETEIDNLN